MQILRRPETAQGRLGFWESYHSMRTRTADPEIAQAVRRFRSANYYSVVSELLELFAPSRRQDDDEPVVDARAFACARDLLDTLPNGYAVPEVSVDPDGEIAFDWIRPDRTMVSISVGLDGVITYAARLRDGTAHGIIQLGSGFPGPLAELLRRLYHPA